MPNVPSDLCLLKAEVCKALFYCTNEGRFLEKMQNEVLYGISVNGKKPHEWNNERPDIKQSNLDLDMLKHIYKSYEVIKMKITYEVEEKFL